MTDRIAVVGLWHLGCTISAVWAELGRPVVALDFVPSTVERVRGGRAPLFEPGLDDALTAGLASGRLQVTDDPEAVRGCRFVFVAYDTPVGDDDSSDITPITEAVERCAPHLDPRAVVIVSAQLPVGTARVLRASLQRRAPTAELTYSPENLRLGQALQCYRRPGHVVVGAETQAAGDAVEALFAPMQARCLRMNLPSAEMAKHGINGFLAASIALANHWADACVSTGGDFADVAAAMRADPRIGERAYLGAGLGFSGGTLGRDLRVLEEVNRTALNGSAPLFGEIWRYNQRRIGIIARRADAVLGGLAGRTLGLLGMTYKPGTSTLRRSLPLAVANDLLTKGACVQAHDPLADWAEIEPPAALHIVTDPYAAAEGAEMLVLLTEWPQYAELDFARLGGAMRRRVLFDTKGFLRSRAARLNEAGFSVLELARATEPEGT